MSESVLYKGYRVFKDGTILGQKGLPLKPGIASNGYYTVVICYEGMQRTELIHRIVATCFLPNPENKRTVNHKNGIKTGNHFSNLEWNTDKENIGHAFRTVLIKNVGPSTRQRMQKTVIDTATGVKYRSAVYAASQNGINPDTLRGWLCGKRPNKTTMKYLK